MAILYMDGFDHYTDTAVQASSVYVIAPNLWNWSGTGTPSPVRGVLDTMPVLGGKGLKNAFQGQAATYVGMGGPKLKLPSGNIVSGQTLGFSFHYYIDVIPTDGSTSILGFINSSDNGSDTASRSIKLISGGTLGWCVGTPDKTPAATSTNTISSGNLYHIEIKILFHASAGTIDVRVNGAAFWSATGLNTLPTSTSPDRVQMGQTWGTTAGSSKYMYYDDLVIWDDSGTINNDFIGERNIVTLFPNADTSTADWTLSTGTDGYDLINDVPADDDTNYLSSDTVGNESQFDLESLTNTGVSITALQPLVRASKADSGAASIDVGVVTSGGTADYSGDQTLTQDQFLHFTHISELNPDTSAAWTPTDIASLKIGIKRA